MRNILLGIDMGGTNIRAGPVSGNTISSIYTAKVNSTATTETILSDLYHFLDPIVQPSFTAIGIGVPGLVDEKGIVYDVQNIPSWVEVPLKELLEKKYRIPVFINNDANCFAVGEHFFGKGRGHDSMIGLTIGTGLGGGVIINNKLYSGKNCGAGEFGMIGYMDNYTEYYASGQFFQNVFKMNGDEVFKLASSGNPEAIEMYKKLGFHLGNAIKNVMYAYDVDLIVIGGSVRHAWSFFSDEMWKQLRTFAYHRPIENLKIELSELENSGILGAAALYFNFMT